MSKLKLITILIALLISGLNAGFYTAWQISVIQGTKRISTSAYLETMQSINRAILNPFFMILFLGGLAILAWTTYQMANHQLAFQYGLGATLLYLLGVLGVTILGNVPLNDMLDATNLKSLSIDQAESLRMKYEDKWNLLHLIRSAFALLSFVFYAFASYYYVIAEAEG